MKWFMPTSTVPWIHGWRGSVRCRLGVRRRSSMPPTATAMEDLATRRRKVGMSTDEPCCRPHQKSSEKSVWTILKGHVIIPHRTQHRRASKRTEEIGTDVLHRPHKKIPSKFEVSGMPVFHRSGELLLFFFFFKENCEKHRFYHKIQFLQLLHKKILGLGWAKRVYLCQ